MKTLFFLAALTLGDGYYALRVRSADNVVTGVASTDVDSTAAIGVAKAGEFLTTVPANRFTDVAVRTDDDELPGYVYRTGPPRVVARTAAAILQERSVLRRRRATVRLGELKARLTSLQAVAPTTPTTEYTEQLQELQAKVDAAKTEAGLQ